MLNHGIFVAKIYDYALINSLRGPTGFLDSAASYAALVEGSLSPKPEYGKSGFHNEYRLLVRGEEGKYQG